THNNSGTSKLTGALTVAGGAVPTATPDLTNNLIVVAGGATPAATRDALTAQIIAGRNVPVGGVGDGTWTGKGITSSTAAARFVSNFSSETNAVGIALNSDLVLTLGSYTSFGGQGVGANDILIRYTLN